MRGNDFLPGVLTPFPSVARIAAFRGRETVRKRGASRVDLGRGACTVPQRRREELRVTYRFFQTKYRELHAQFTTLRQGYYLIGSVSKVEMVTPIALIYKILFPSISMFETLPPSLYRPPGAWCDFARHPQWELVMSGFEVAPVLALTLALTGASNYEEPYRLCDR
jgi:hypothetical protein